MNAFSANLVSGLLKAGVSAEILLTGVTYRERKPMPLPQGIPVKHLRLPAIATWKKRWQNLVEYLEAQAPCIYLPNHDFNHSCVSSALSSRIGVVGIVHSDDTQHYDHAMRLGKTWNAAVAVSETIARRCRDSSWLDSERLTTIPYGVPVSDRPPTHEDAGKLRLVYAGRLEREQKRSGDLIELAATLVQRELAFTLTIVGDGPERRAIEQSIGERGLRSWVTLLPTVSNQEAIALCARHDVFILPSAYEGMPVSLLEAMGQGCIPLASEIASGVPELVIPGMNGLTFSPGDVAALASRVEELAESPELRKRLSHEAWLTIAGGDYRVEVMVARYVALFEKVWSEIGSGTFARPGNGRVASLDLPLRERLTAPLWGIRPSIRAQQRIPS